MAKYIKQSDRAAQSAEFKALGVLEAICDSKDASQCDKQQAAQKILELVQTREKVTPLKSAFAERIKSERKAQAKARALTAELEQANARLAELEPLPQQLTDARSEIERLGSALSVADKSVTSAERQTATATATVKQYQSTVAALIDTLVPEEKRLGVGAKLFFLKREIVPEVYELLGINLSQWRALDERLQHAENMLRLWELDQLGEAEQQFVNAKLHFRFSISAKEELERRAAERKAFTERADIEKMERAEARRTAKVSQQQSDALHKLLYEEQPPTAPAVLTWGKDVR
jgi:hypothetical protein